MHSISRWTRSCCRKWLQHTNSTAHAGEPGEIEGLWCRSRCMHACTMREVRRGNADFLCSDAAAVLLLLLRWDACSQVLNYNQIRGDMVPIYEDLFANSSIRILVYSGDVDSCVPYLGTELTVLSFPFAQKTPIKDPWQSWHYVAREAPAIKNQVGGKFVQFGERLAYATVRGAGHMVPHDRSEAAIALFNSFMNDPTGFAFNKAKH